MGGRSVRYTGNKYPSKEKSLQFAPHFSMKHVHVHIHTRSLCLCQYAYFCSLAEGEMRSFIFRVVSCLDSKYAATSSQLAYLIWKKGTPACQHLQMWEGHMRESYANPAYAFEPKPGCFPQRSTLVNKAVVRAAFHHKTHSSDPITVLSHGLDQQGRKHFP